MTASPWTPAEPLRTALSDRLQAVAASRTRETTAEALRALAGWLDDDHGRCELPPGAGLDGGSAAARLWLLGWTLERQPDDAAHVGAAIASLLTDVRCVPFFARTGIATEARLTSELADRIARKVLPQASSDDELGQLLGDVLERRGFLRAAPGALVLRVLEVLSSPDRQLAAARAQLDAALVDAAVLVSVRIATLGTADDVHERAGGGALAASPFVQLGRVADRLLPDAPDRRSADGAGASMERAVVVNSLRSAIPACHEAVQRVRASLERGSVSADLVFRLDVADRMLARLALVCGILEGGPDADTHLLAAVRQLLDEREEDTTLRGLLRSSSRLLARRIVETSAETGEHYIARNAREYRRMWASAAGGGGLMAVVAPIKYLLSWLHLPLFFAGLAAGANYALAFIAMQVLGLTLATKQPSMTAASLAGALGDDVGSDTGPAGRARVVELIGRTTRTQLAAVIGNIGALIPVSVALHFAIVALAEAPFFEQAAALKILHGHSLIGSGSVLFAALTGVWLWLSSIAASWFDNWIRYRRLPDALLGNRRIRRFVGHARADAAARLMDRAAGPLFGNIVIGMLLGLTPAFAGFFGAPVEIRHITIATASVVMAALSLEPQHLDAATLGWAIAGLVAIAAMNFAVSFALALLVALRARDVGADAVRALVVDLLRAGVRSPGAFVRPVEDTNPAAPSAAAAGAPALNASPSHEGSNDRAA